MPDCENLTDHSSVRSFEWEAGRDGLTLYPFMEARRVFHVCIAEPIRVYPNLRIMRELVALARKHAISEHLGAHNILLAQYADRAQLASKKSVIWRPRSLMQYAGDADRMVSLAQLLREHGMAYIP